MEESSTVQPFRYTTQKEPIVLREYGRHVQQMAEHLLTIEDREQRNRMAFALVDLMKRLNPNINSRDFKDYEQQLWDHLHIMADWKLDVDAPYDPPERDILEKQPQPMSYPKPRFRYRPFGENLEKLTQEIAEIEDEEKKIAAVNYLCRLRKIFIYTYNKETVDDDLLIEQVQKSAKGKLDDIVQKMRDENQFSLFVRFNQLNFNQNTGGGSNKNKRGKRKNN